MNSSSTLDKKLVEDILALTPMQEGLLYYYRKSGHSAQYCEHLILQLEGDIQWERVITAWADVQEANEALRAVFRWEGLNSPVQVILKQKPLPLQHEDYSHLPLQEALERAEQVQQQIFSQPIDIASEPYRIVLIQLEAGRSVMLFSYHHILLDGWSMGQVIHEWITAYTSGTAMDVIKPKLKTFVKWLKQNDKAAQKLFWTEYLSGIDSKAALPGYRFNQGEANVTGMQSLNICWGPKETEAINNFVRNHEVTLSACLFAAWGQLLQVYNDTDDVIIGTAVSGRKSEIEGIDSLVGVLSNTIPMRIRTDQTETVIQFVQRIHKEYIQLESFENTPLLDIRAYSEFDNASTMFDFLMVVENYPIHQLLAQDAGKEIRITAADFKEANHYPLTFTVMKYEHILSGVLTYDRNIFQENTISAIIELFQSIVNKIVTSPNTLLQDMNWLPEHEVDKLLMQDRHPGGSTHYFYTLPQLLEQQAAIYPGRLAIVSNQEDINYCHLNKKVHQVARNLIRYNIEPGSVVAVSLPRSIHLLTTILGIMRAGCVYMPIDPRLPEERAQYMYADAEARCVVTDRPDIFDAPGIQTFSFEDLEQVGVEDTSTLPVYPQLSSLAYIMYTSGSTGKPKGVMVSHQALMNRLYWSQQTYPLTPDDTLLQKTSIGFDVSLWELFWWILAGARLCLLEPGKEGNPQSILEAASRYQVTVIHFVPTMLGAFLDYIELNADAPGSLSGLQRVFTSGESLKLGHAERFQTLLGHCNGTKLTNLYGPTEAAIEVAYYDVEDCSQLSSIPIGRAISNVHLLILDRYGRLQPKGAVGELYIGGICLAEGYMNQPTLSEQSFVRHPWFEGERLYRSGDIAAWLLDGNIEYLGRRDQQVKLRGYRIEIMEIEEMLLSLQMVQNAVVVLNEQQSALIAFVTSSQELKHEEIKGALRRNLPEYMIPSFILQVPEIILTSSGKADRKALLKHYGIQQQTMQPQIRERNATEGEIHRIWSQVIQRTDFGIDDNFFEVGGHSLSLLQVQLQIQQYFKRELALEEMFRLPTIRLLAEHMDGLSRTAQSGQLKTRTHLLNQTFQKEDIAIIGMSGRFPGAANLEDFWNNLVNGVESISFFSDEDLFEAGVSKEEMSEENYVKASGILEEADCFDAEFFGINPHEAEMMDPQHRIFLECSWEALEHAGYNPLTYTDRIGLFAGSSISSYLIHNVLPYIRNRSWEEYGAMLGNDKDFLCTRVAHKLHLRGPCVNVQSACSTSLVAVYMACQSLWQRQCEMAMAGGVSVQLPQIQGYLYQSEGIKSLDGHCRAFDEQASGTVNGNGAGIVVLKRKEDAERDGDYIYAVIKGGAINNDGGRKLGYTAPGVEGQAEVIIQAHLDAQVSPDTISYVEAHGTGTKLGDPIEIAALTKAYRTRTEKSGFCAIGSVKTNIGHLDAAAGIAGLIKTILSLQHKQIPPSLHCESPHSRTSWSTSPFYVCNSLLDWTTKEYPRRAGVSSFGIGGTNAHLILEEYQQSALESSSFGERDMKLIVLSGKSEDRLLRSKERVKAYLRSHSESSLADMAYTLHTGRAELEYRQFWIAQNANDLMQQLEQSGGSIRRVMEGSRAITFLFPGQGTEYVGMGRELYETEAYFRQLIDSCAEVLLPMLQLDIREFLLERYEGAAHQNPAWSDTAYIQPMLFTLEYSLAKLWMHWGVQPDSLLGHSLGEITAACLAGVFTLPDALWLVTERGKWMQKSPSGAMLALGVAENHVSELLQEFDVNLAAVNSSHQIVLSGIKQQIDMVQRHLGEKGIKCRLLNTQRAFHSPQMDEVLEGFSHRIEQLELMPPKIPFLSNLTGHWITDEEATSSHYWVRHIRETVQFERAIAELVKEPSRVFIEVGPGHVLSSFVRLHRGFEKSHEVLCSMPTDRQGSESQALLKSLGLLWQGGTAVDWTTFYEEESRKRCPLPGHYLKRTRYWIESEKRHNVLEQPKKNKKSVSLSWLNWMRISPHDIRKAVTVERAYVIYHLGSEIGNMAANQLVQSGQRVFVIDAWNLDARNKLLTWLHEGQEPVVIMDFRPLNLVSDVNRYYNDADDLFDMIQICGTRVAVVTVITREMFDVACDKPSDGGAESFLQETSQFQNKVSQPLRVIDLDWDEKHPGMLRLVSSLLQETLREDALPITAFRGNCRWQCALEPLPLDHADTEIPTENKVILLLGTTSKVTCGNWKGFPGVQVIRAEDCSCPDSRRVDREYEFNHVVHQAIAQHGQLHGVMYMMAPEDIIQDRESRDSSSTIKESRQNWSELERELFALKLALEEVPLEFVMLIHSSQRMELNKDYAGFKEASFSHLMGRVRQSSSLHWHSVWLEDSLYDVLYMNEGTGSAVPGEEAEICKQVYNCFNAIIYEAEAADWFITSAKASTLDRLSKESLIQPISAMDDDNMDSSCYNRPPLNNVYISPLDPVEICIAGMWQELLHINPIGRNDHFLELGGNSLIGLQLISRLQEVFQLEYKLEYLLTHPTVAQTHQKLVELRGDEGLVRLYVEAYNTVLNSI